MRVRDIGLVLRTITCTEVGGSELDPSARSTEITTQVIESGAIAVLRLRQHDHAVAVGQRLVAAGIAVLEVTFDHPDAEDTLAALGEQLPATTVLGAGTVRQVGQVARCKAAGGRFCVSPHTDPAIVRACFEHGLEPIPGIQTPTEVASAVGAGATLLKLFPAGPLGTGHLRALRGPFPDVGFVPTGGIRHDEVGAWLTAGAVAVGLGSDLVPAEPDESDLDDIARRATAVADQVARHRGRGHIARTG